jgi:hypothetical protein
LFGNQNNQVNQIRTKMVDHRMVKDHKKRKIFQEHGPERFRINMVRKSKEIPRELKVCVLPYMASFICYLSLNCYDGRFGDSVSKIKIKMLKRIYENPDTNVYQLL